MCDRIFRGSPRERFYLPMSGHIISPEYISALTSAIFPFRILGKEFLKE
jgi:hypothetical protein